MIGNPVDGGIHAIRLAHRPVKSVAMYAVAGNEQRAIDIEKVSVGVDPVKAV